MDLNTKREAMIVSPTSTIQPAEVAPVNDVYNIEIPHLIDIADIKPINEHNHSDESDSHSDSHGCGYHNHCGGCYSHCCCSCSSDSSTSEETEPDCYLATKCGEPTQCYVADTLQDFWKKHDFDQSGCLEVCEVYWAFQCGNVVANPAQVVSDLV